MIFGTKGNVKRFPSLGFTLYFDLGHNISSWSLLKAKIELAVC